MWFPQNEIFCSGCPLDCLGIFHLYHDSPLNGSCRVITSSSGQNNSLFSYVDNCYFYLIYLLGFLGQKYNHNVAFALKFICYSVRIVTLVVILRLSGVPTCARQDARGTLPKKRRWWRHQRSVYVTDGRRPQ